MNEVPDGLFAADEPAPVTVHNENGRSPFLIVADHADNCIPRALVRLCFAASRPVATERPLLAIASRDCCICVEGRARQVSSLGLLLRSPHARLA